MDPTPPHPQHPADRVAEELSSALGDQPVDTRLSRRQKEKMVGWAMKDEVGSLLRYMENKAIPVHEEIGG